METKNEAKEVVSTLELNEVYKANYRLKCWNYWKLSTALSIVSWFFGYLLSFMWNSGFTSLVSLIFWIALTYMSIVLMINRFHDLWKSGWNVLCMLIPLYNIYLAIILSFSKWKKIDNEYGKYMDKQIVFNPIADKVFHVLTVIWLVLCGVALLGVLLFFVIGVANFMA